MNTRRFVLPALLTLALVGMAPSTESLARPQADMPEAGCDFADCPGGKGPGVGMRCPGFSPEQQQKYAAIVAEYAKKMEPVEDQVFVKRQELRALQNAATPSVEAVRETATELRKLGRQLRALHAEMSQRLETEVGKPAAPAPRSEKPRHGKRHGEGPARTHTGQ